MWLIEGDPAGALSLIRNTGQKHSTAESRPFMEENHEVYPIDTSLTYKSLQKILSTILQSVMQASNYSGNTTEADILAHYAKVRDRDEGETSSNQSEQQSEDIDALQEVCSVVSSFAYAPFKVEVKLVVAWRGFLHMMLMEIRDAITKDEARRELRRRSSDAATHFMIR